MGWAKPHQHIARLQPASIVNSTSGKLLIAGTVPVFIADAAASEGRNVTLLHISMWSRSVWRMTLRTLSSSGECRQKQRRWVAIFETTDDDLERRAADMLIARSGQKVRPHGWVCLDCVPPYAWAAVGWLSPAHARLG